MLNLIRSVLVIVAAAAPMPAVIAPAPNVLVVVVGNGPHAGTYKIPVEETICVHYKSQGVFAATYKNFDAKEAKDVADAAINVNNPDAAGAKVGTMQISFGVPGKNPTSYVINQTPVTLVIKGKGADISGDSKTKDGVQLKVTASCGEVEVF